MKNFFSLVIIAAIAAGGGFFLYNMKATQEARAKTELQLRDARRSFTERVRASVTEEDTDAYLRGVKSALQSYESELKTVVYKDRPEWFDIDREKKKLDEQFEERKIKESTYAGIMKRIELVKGAYQILMDGSWRPALTKVGKGDTRLDLFNVQPIVDSRGNPVLEVQFFLWGVEPNSRLSYGSLSLEYWVEEAPDAKTKRKRRREGRDPNAPVFRLLGRAEGDAKPFMSDPNPGRTIAEFPSYVAVGSIRLPRVPREAKLMDFKYEYTVVKGGAEYRSELVWEKMEIPPQWRLSEGETWVADEVEASEDELAGFDPTADAGTQAAP